MNEPRPIFADETTTTPPAAAPTLSRGDRVQWYSLHRARWYEGKLVAFIPAGGSVPKELAPAFADPSAFKRGARERAIVEVEMLSGTRLFCPPARDLKKLEV